MSKHKNKHKPMAKVKTKASTPAPAQWYTLTTTKDGHPILEIPPTTYDSLDEARYAARKLHDSLASARETTAIELSGDMLVTGRYRSKICYAQHTTSDIGTITEGEYHA